MHGWASCPAGGARLPFHYISRKLILSMCIRMNAKHWNAKHWNAKHFNAIRIRLQPHCPVCLCALMLHPTRSPNPHPSTHPPIISHPRVVSLYPPIGTYTVAERIPCRWRRLATNRQTLSLQTSASGTVSLTPYELYLGNFSYTHAPSNNVECVASFPT